MAMRPSLLTRGLSSASGADTGSPAEQRDDAKKNMLKAMRPLPTQHYWNVYFDRYANCWELLPNSSNCTKDSRRNNRSPPMEAILLHSNSLDLRSSPYKTSGVTTITLPLIRSRCENQSICSSKVFSPYGKIGET
jgi:hypothetical protein